jgi:phosphoserine phosphatase RsbU/P
MPVGKFGDEHAPFNMQSVQLQKGDIVYTFTDGYADQFGGPKGKKFKYKQLEDLLLTNAHLPMEEQKTILNTKFEAWKGNLEQVDDVLVIGIKI